MNLQTFKYLPTVAQEGSISKAAEKLFITPSALSQYITKEENCFGLQFFVRAKDKWTLTPAGQAYVESAKQILAIGDNLCRELEDMADCKTGQFSVGITPSRGAEMLSAIYPVFQQEYPGVKVHLIEANWKRLYKLTMEETLDISFTSLCDPEEYSKKGLDAIELSKEEFVLFLPKTHPLASKYEALSGDSSFVMDLYEFAGDSFIGYSKETTLHKDISGLFKQAGISPNIIFESASTSAVHNMVNNGMGIAIMPSFYARKPQNALWFRINPTAELKVLAVKRKGYQMSKAMQYFVELCREYFQSLNII